MTQIITDEQKLARRVLIKLEEVLSVAEDKKMTSTQALASSSKETANHQRSEEEEAIYRYIDAIRLDMKYIKFDTEALRRENDYLRRMLDEQSNSE